MFWLASGIPEGVVRHWQRVVWDPTSIEETTTRLTNLDVRLKAWQQNRTWILFRDRGRCTRRKIQASSNMQEQGGPRRGRLGGDEGNVG